MLLQSKQTPSINDFPLTYYSVAIPLGRLSLGVDNLRYDVYISPEFIKSAGALIFQLILKHAHASKALQTQEKILWYKQIDQFKNLCTQVLVDAINKAKSQREIQIDYLAQIAIVKRLLKEIQYQYDAAIHHFKNVIRKQEIAQRLDAHFKLREEVSVIIQQRNRILQQVGTELFSFFTETRKELNELRHANFGSRAILPEEFFSNPMFHASSRPNDFFMMSHYVLLGHRLEDPLNYSAMMATLTSFFNNLGIQIPLDQKPSDSDVAVQAPPSEVFPMEEKMGASHPAIPGPQERAIEGFIKQVENIDILFNYYETITRIKKLKKKKREKASIDALKSRARAQKWLLNKLYKLMNQEKIIDGIVAAYEMEPVINAYCPPLSPQEVLQYLAIPKSKKTIIRKIKRFNKYTGKTIPLSGLHNGVNRVHRVRSRKRKEYLIRFVKDLARYHRDYGNYYLFKETVDSINVTEDEKIIRLSRENHTLYEFVLPSEHRPDSKQIINHVVIKADVRGSTEIVGQMKAKGLNPASNFSLNFFEPINNLLRDYSAEKVFIEGDAIILSIFEHEHMPERWYGVARACGIALSTLMIVRRYNRENAKNRLPRLDLGIGIAYSSAAPTFFYDGNTQIMISPPINQADRMASCDRVLRERFSKLKLPFNLYVLEIDEHATRMKLPINTPVLRYNVMGIELSAEGFEKLSNEIHLTRMECRIPEMKEHPFVIYTGKFPTTSGAYQRIIIREDDIMAISPKDFKVTRKTGRKYYEVCTQPKLYEYVKLHKG